MVARKGATRPSWKRRLKRQQRLCISGNRKIGLARVTSRQQGFKKRAARGRGNLPSLRFFGRAEVESLRNSSWAPSIACDSGKMNGAKSNVHLAVTNLSYKACPRTKGKFPQPSCKRRRSGALWPQPPSQQQLSLKSSKKDPEPRAC